MLDELLKRIRKFVNRYLRDTTPFYEERRGVEYLARKYRGRVIWDDDDRNDTPS